MMMYSLLMVGARLALLAACWTYAGGAYAQESRAVLVVSVCETLRNLKVYNGKTVVIVARSGWTFEGTFMDEQCGPDGRILIRGRRWLSMIEQVNSTRDNVLQPLVFPADETSLWTKLTQVSGYAEPTGENWVAVYGRIESPIQLTQHLLRGARSYVGNGYGANGTVPARICVISSKNLIQGHGFFSAPKHLRPLLDLSEPPLIPFVVPASLPVWLFPPVPSRIR